MNFGEGGRYESRLKEDEERSVDLARKQRALQQEEEREYGFWRWIMAENEGEGGVVAGERRVRKEGASLCSYNRKRGKL